MLSQWLSSRVPFVSRIGPIPQRVELPLGEIWVSRNHDGVAEIWAERPELFMAGLGYMHGVDRRLQILVTRLVYKGQLSEKLRADPESIAIDKFMRSIDFWGAASRQAQEASQRLRYQFSYYIVGLTQAMRQFGVPLELRALGIHQIESWSLEDSLTIMLLMSYIGLAQSQQDAQKLIYESLARGIPPERLRNLFSPYLDELQDEHIELYKKVRFGPSAIPASLLADHLVPTLRGSNNWALSPRRCSDHGPLIAGDPHLEINRLPALWYECIGHLPQEDLSGITVPGVPAIIMGRNRNLAFNFTYGYLDMIDHFVEECQNGKFRRDNEWFDFHRRDVQIKPKGKPPVEFTVYESDIGPLELPEDELRPKDGFYLSRRFGPAEGGLCDTLERIIDLGLCDHVKQAQEISSEIITSCNWIFADRQGNIGYQQSGYAPRRVGSGLIAYPAWEYKYHWQGRRSGSELHRITNPPSGLIVTANEAINPDPTSQSPDPGAVSPAQDSATDASPIVVCNLSGAKYRKERILELLSNRDDLSVDDCKELLLDLRSLQAERIMKHLRPYLPSDRRAELLMQWNCQYRTDSKAPTLFEAIYEQWLLRCFGDRLFGREAWEAITKRSYLFTVYFQYFDDILLGDSAKRWWSDHEHDRIIQQSIAATWSRYPRLIQIPVWGKVNRMDMRHILLGSKAPSILRLNRGPISLPGGRATIRQSQIYQAGGRPIVTGVSHRMVCDLNSSRLHTTLPGGPSDRSLSPWYDNDLTRWSKGFFKTLQLDNPRPEPKPSNRPKYFPRKDD